MFIASAYPTEGLKPSDGPLYLPSTFVPSQQASILGFALPVFPVQGDHFDADLAEIGIKSITVIRLITAWPLREIESERSVEHVWTRLTSAGLALLVCTSSGMPLASTMILVPLPFLVGPTSEPPFWRP